MDSLQVHQSSARQHLEYAVYLVYQFTVDIWVCVCVCHMAGRTVRSPCYTRATTEHFGDQALLIEQGLTSHQTHYRSYRGRAFTGQMTQPIVSEH